MKTSRLVAAAALSFIAAIGAHAETYDGVHPLTTENNRADVNALAVIAAHSPDPYAEGYSAGVAPTLSASADRATVRAGAVAAAHAPNQNLRREAYAGSVIPPQYATMPSETRQAGLASPPVQ
jgi:hypothetical protein